MSLYSASAPAGLHDCCTHRLRVTQAIGQVLMPQLTVGSLENLWLPHQRRSVAVGKADQLVLGSIVTGVNGDPIYGAMAIKDGRIAALGSADELEALKGPDTEVVVAGDGFVTPGLIEPHMHIWASVMVDDWIDCSAIENRRISDVTDRLRAAVTSAGPGDWVRGQLFDPSQYPGEPDLTSDILDQVSRDVPIAVLNASMHFLYVNSKAFEIAGITAETPDPPSGKFYREDGKLTGVCGESGAILAFLAHQPPMTPEHIESNLRGILSKAASQGVTSARDAMVGAVLGTSEFAFTQQLSAGQRLATRVSTAQFSQLGLQAWTDAGVTPGAGDDLVRASAWKVVSDGSNQGRSGYMREPYLDGDGGRGEANWSLDELTEFIREGHNAGWQVMTHANGDAALDETLAAYEAALDGQSGLGLRHRVEHCSLTHDGQLAKMAELGISPSFLMNHVYFWGRTFRDNLIGPERAALLDRVGGALRAGLRPSLHSDYSVSHIRPLLSARTAVFRVPRDEATPLGPDDCVTAEQALTAITTDAAWQINADDQGALKVGNHADFAIFSDNPWTADPSTWADITCRETRIAGTTAWSA